MANPTTRWDYVPVYGVYLRPDDTPIAGELTFAFPQRVLRVDGRVIYAAGATIKATIGDMVQQDSVVRAAIRAAWRAADQAAQGVDFDGALWDVRWDDVIVPGAIFARFPALDDTDIVHDPANPGSVTVQEALQSGVGKQYAITPLLAQMDLPIPGINLGTIEVPPGSVSVPAPMYAKGVPGGVASLDVAGKVPVGQIPDGVGGASTVDELTDATTVGKAVVKAASQTAARTALGAASEADRAAMGATLSEAIGLRAFLDDSRFSDQRIPTDGSVTNAKVAGGAGIVLDKTADSTGSTGRLAMTNAERSKLTGVATGATANDTDANLKNRANHTGTQAISTVTGLQTALDAKAADADVAKLTGAQTVAGVKTFSSSPLVPTPTTGSQAAPKSYADALIAALSGVVGQAFVIQGLTGARVDQRTGMAIGTNGTAIWVGNGTQADVPNFVAGDVVLDTTQYESYVGLIEKEQNINYAVPAAEQMFFATNAAAVRLRDLRGYSQIRLISIRLGLTNGQAGAKLRLGYRIFTDGVSASGGAAYTDVGVTEVKNMIDGTGVAPAGVVDSGWIDIAAGAKTGPVFLGLLGSGGNGSTSVGFQAITLALR